MEDLLYTAISEAEKTDSTSFIRHIESYYRVMEENKYPYNTQHARNFAYNEIGKAICALIDNYQEMKNG